MPPLSAEPSPQDDWDPRSPAVLQDQLAAYDEMRGRCPVAHSEYLGWSLFRHADVLQVVEDHQTFSNVVSTHLNVPDGMDPPEHTVYREMVDRYFTTELVDAFEVECRRVVGELLGELPRDGSPWDVAELSDQVDYAALAECLDLLAALDPRQANIVAMRFFMGMTAEQIATALDISTSTVQREWRLARAWLQRELER